MPEELADKLNTPIADPDWREGQWHVEDMLIVPLVALSGEVLGLISLDEPKNGKLPDRPHVQALEFFADQCATAVVAAREFEVVRTEAHTDALTGLANRRALLIALERAVGRHLLTGEPVSVLFADIDHFKSINDTHGHGVGDVVLQWIARALSERLRRNDVLARYGGEEFVVLLPDTTVEAATAIAEGLRGRIESVNAPTPGRPLRLRVSIGVAGVSSRLATAEDVLAAADSAMYLAKRTGRNKVSVAPAGLPGSSPTVPLPPATVGAWP